MRLPLGHKPLTYEVLVIARGGQGFLGSRLIDEPQPKTGVDLRLTRRARLGESPAPVSPADVVDVDQVSLRCLFHTR